MPEIRQQLNVVIRPGEGLYVADYGLIALSTPKDALTGVVVYKPEYSVTAPVRFENIHVDYDDNGLCSFLEIVGPRDEVVPVLDGQPVRGPTIREAAKTLVSLGYPAAVEVSEDPQTFEELEALFLGNDFFPDTVFFPHLSLALWTEGNSEDDDGIDHDEPLLDTVSIAVPGYYGRRVRELA